MDIFLLLSSEISIKQQQQNTLKKAQNTQQSTKDWLK